MNLIILAALIAACGAAKLDRTYLPPASAATAGGSPGILQTLFSRSNQDSQSIGDIPPGGFVNQHQGVVVDAASADTRATNALSGLGNPRISYGSTASKVGEAAFRVTGTNQFQYNPGQVTFGVLPGQPDLSAFHQPISSRPGNFQILRDYVSNTVKYQNDIDNDKYNYAFETDNGIKAAENGVSTDGVQAQGGYSYTGDDGKVYSVVYTAGEDGYQPSGNHLPTPPPIPAEILESLEKNAKEEAAGVVDDGSYDAQKYNTDDDYTKNDANDKQSNKFGDRPGSGGNGFINQQAFVSPNFNGQFGSNNVKVTKPGSSQFGNVLGQNNNGYNNNNEYLPPKGTFVRPSSYDTSNSGPSSGIASKPTIGAGSSLGNGNSNSPFNTGSSFGNGDSNSPSNTGSSLVNENSNSPFNTGSSFGNGNSNSPFNTGSSFGNGNSNSPFNTGSSFGNGNSNSPSNSESSFGIGNSNSPSITESTFGNGNSPSNTGSSVGNENSNSPFNTGSSFGNGNSPSNTGSSVGNENSNSLFNSGSLLGNGNSNSPFNTGNSFGNENSPSNTGSSLGNQNSNSPFNTGSSFGNENLISPFNTVTSFGNGNTPLNTGSVFGNGNLNSVKPGQTFDGDSSLNQGSFPNQPINSNFGISTSNIQKNPIQPSSSLPGTFNPNLGTSFDLTLEPVSPTKQPELTLTTPLESFGDSNSDKQSTETDINKTKEPTSSFAIGQITPTEIIESGQTDTDSEISPIQSTSTTNGDVSKGTSTFESIPQKPQGIGTQTTQSQENLSQIFSSNQPKDVDFASTTRKPSYSSTSQFGQSQGSDDSYVYNRPSKPFYTPSGSSENNKPSSLFDKVTSSITSQTSLFTNSPQGTTFSFNNQGSTKYPNPPTLAQIVPGTSTLGITQASISPFPSLEPTVSSNFKQPSQFGFKPNQQNSPFNTPSVSAFSQASPTSATATAQISQEKSETQPQEGNTNTPNQQYNGEVYEYNVPTQGLSSQNQKPLNPTLTSQSADLNTGINEQNLSTTGKQDSTFTPQSQTTERPSNRFNQGTSISQNQDNGLTITTSKFEQGISNNQESSSFPQFSTTNTQTSIQSGFDTVKPISSLSQNQPELSNTGSSSGLGLVDTKGSDAKLQQTNGQPISQFGSKPSAFFPSSLQQFSGSTTPTPVTPFGIFSSSKNPSIQQLPSRTQSGSAFGQGNFYNKGTAISQSFQQPGTQFGYKPTTIFPSSFQTQTSIFNTPNSATQQQNIFASSKKPFGSQSSLQFGQGSFGNKGTTVPIFHQPGTHFGYRPSTIGTSPFQPQFGQQSISTSPKTPSQQIIFGSRPTSQFGAGNLNTYQNYKPSTSVPSSTFAQSSIFNSQRPTNQFGQSSFPASKLPTFQTSQPGLVSTATIGQQPNQQFGTQFNYKPTTSIPRLTGTQSGSFSTSKIPNTQSSQFNIQSSSPIVQSTFGDKGTTVSGTFGYKPSSSSQPQGSSFSTASANSQFGQTSDSTLSQKPIGTSFGLENDNEKTTSQQTVNSFNKPSTLLPSTSQGTQFGEIYDYQKPAQNFITPSEIDNSNTQSQSNTQQGLPTTQTGPEPSEQSTNAQPDAQLNQASINDKDTTFNLFSQKPESGTPLNSNKATPTFPSTSQEQSSFGFDQSTTTGEIYEYNKPDQGLTSSEKEDTQFGQKLQRPQTGQQSSGNGNNFDSNQGTSPQLTQSTLSGSFGSQKLDSSTTEAPVTGSTSGSHPQFAFHSACCRGSIINRKPVIQNNLKPIDSFGQNKNPQEGSQTFAGVGEQFGGPRKPPSFDKTGYHY